MSPDALAARDASTRQPTITTSAGASDPAAQEPRFQPGDRFGPYRIGRLLGRGGMGEVYEANHPKQHRVVALKVVNQRLRRADDRARFLEEGQRAASVNHPNSVYIFGSEEIDDIPVITMELLPGGTIKDRVTASGPLPPSEAVEAILQVIAGLDAAHAAGILHRDVKPSNCFIDHTGTVKIGDFGLSISTLSRGVTSLDEAGAFQGTPDFASPEQLRGEPLDVRADIYAVGATLFYLLTARPPSPGQSPRGFQPTIPWSLDNLVTRCMATHPDARFRTYESLIQELQRFRSVVTTPADVGVRLAAGRFDVVILIPILGALLAILIGSGLIKTVGAALEASLVVALLYWTVSEGLWGTTLGKRSSGLRVVTTDGRPLRIDHAFMRAAIFLMPAMLVLLLAAAAPWMDQPEPPIWLTLVVAVGATLGVIFASARPRNGFAGLHDLFSGTRVVQQSPADTQQARTSPEPAATATDAPPAQPSSAHIGPYVIVSPLGPTEGGELFLAFDPLLKRQVWVHVVPSGTPPAPSSARDITPPGALHWLNGERVAFGGWDAYEAPDGAPLLSMSEPHPWHHTRQWLRDLASELDARLNLGLLDPLGLDRVWITRAGRAKFLDFHAPGASISTTVAEPLSTRSAQRFLHAVATRALGGSTIPPLPLSASAVLNSLERGGFTTLPDAISALTRLQTQPDRVSQRSREITLVVDAFVTLVGALVLGRLLANDLVSPFIHETAKLWALSYRDVGELACALLGIGWAFTWRGGFWLRAFGIALVAPDGAEVSHLRAAARALVVWSWVPAQVLAIMQGWSSVVLSIFGLKLLFLGWAAANPERGLQDRLLGTHLVPR